MPRKAKRIPSDVGNSQNKYPTPVNQTRAARTQPIRTPTNQPYGEAGRLAASQSAVPLPQAPPVAPAASPAPDARAQLSPELLAAAQQMAGPDAGPGLGAPTDRPHEPLTAGMPIGAGPGPEALGHAPQQATTILRTLADLSGDAELASLANLANALQV